MKYLHQILAEVAANHPQNTAIVEEGKNLSYGELKRQVAVVTARLMDLGVEHGDSVGLFLPNGAGFVVGFFAIVQTGAAVVPLNPHYQAKELTHFLDDSKASVLITAGEFEALCNQVLDELKGRCALLVLDEMATWEPGAGLSEKSTGFADQQTLGIQPQDNVVIQYSSGSTGQPKRIARSHANLAFELGSLAKTLELKSEDKFLGVTPFSHVNGLVRSMLASMRVGATLFPLRDFKRQKVVNTIQEEGISVFIGVPFMFNILTETNFRRPVDLSSLRLCVSASAPMLETANRKFQEKYGFYVRQLYGSTETGTISVNSGSEIENTLESVGLPIKGVEVQVFRDDGSVAAPEEVGEIAVKSPAAITCYENLPTDAETFRDGYFFTGDVGKIDQRSHIYLLGRKKFFINKGGYKINPSEVEILLNGHPKVKEVVVVGVPTSFGDETVKAVVIPSQDCSHSEIIDFCRGKLADFKIPSVVEFRSDLPRTSTGKVIRREL